MIPPPPSPQKRTECRVIPSHLPPPLPHECQFTRVYVLNFVATLKASCLTLGVGLDVTSDPYKLSAGLTPAALQAHMEKINMFPPFPGSGRNRPKNSYILMEMTVRTLPRNAPPPLRECGAKNKIKTRFKCSQGPVGTCRLTS